MIESPEKIKKAVPLIENKVKVRISQKGRSIEIKGSELNEFLVAKIIQAIDFGFDTEDALTLVNPDVILNFINIKDHTRKKNLREVRSRIIGTEGRVKGTIQELTGSSIVINDNKIGLIAEAAHADTALQAVVSIIQGSKQSNVFSYLEKQNATLRKRDSDLGLKNPEEEN